MDVQGACCAGAGGGEEQQPAVLGLALPPVCVLVGRPRAPLGRAAGGRALRHAGDRQPPRHRRPGTGPGQAHVRPWPNHERRRAAPVQADTALLTACASGACWSAEPRQGGVKGECRARVGRRVSGRRGRRWWFCWTARRSPASPSRTQCSRPRSPARLLPVLRPVAPCPAKKSCLGPSLALCVSASACWLRQNPNAGHCTAARPGSSAPGGRGRRGARNPRELPPTHVKTMPGAERRWSGRRRAARSRT